MLLLMTDQLRLLHTKIVKKLLVYRIYSSSKDDSTSMYFLALSRELIISCKPNEAQNIIGVWPSMAPRRYAGYVRSKK